MDAVVPTAATALCRARMAADMTTPEQVDDDADPDGELVGSETRPSRRTVSLIVGAIGAVLVVLVWVLASSPPATTRVTESPLVGRPVPAISAETLDGTTFDIGRLTGRWVLINVFATWCVPCRIEHPELVRFDEAHRARGDAAVVGIIYDDDPDAVRRFRDEEGGEWPMLLDPEGRIALSLGVAGVPESFLVAPDGQVVSKITGGVRFDELEDLLARAQDPSIRPGR
ncbi:TlpA disulfide reductase family protein [Iamia majanohamensis]|uniref:TlpA disulfide reductase family protein n=1 Tax=Iamia majanohamensis TaxID=467976 RepID=A0AAE9Y7J6_9ACTN|nr:TlpA disulfide reductase family protein [Iamia majanohamensis]WCO68007.1 TlpA disulfide reductase family protein [Iamia majanohamensis]